MAMDIGDAKLTIKAEDKTQAAFNSVNKSTKNMSATFKKAGLAITAMGVAMVFTLAKVVNSYSKAGDEVAKMAKRTGFGTEALSELRHAAQLSGASLAGIEKGSRTLSGAITDAGFGLATYVRAFESIGLAYEDLADLSPEEQFIKVMEALAGVEDATLRAAIAADIMGRSGTAMLPMLAEGTEGLVKMRQEAHELNLVFDKEAAAAAEAFEDSKTRLKGALMGLGATIAKEVMPHLEELIVKVKDIMVKFTDWAKEHPKLTDAIIKFGVALTALSIVGGPILLLIGFIPQIIAGFKALTVFINTTLIPTIIRAIAAFIALLASMGPPGWVAIGVGIAAAAVGIAAMAKLIGGVSKESEEAIKSLEETMAGAKGALPRPGIPPGVAGMQYGGIVRRPTVALLGERGAEAVIPLGAKRAGIGSTYNYSITQNIGNLMADEATTRELAQKLLEYIREDQLRTVGLTA